jgi:hypothetical protein
MNRSAISALLLWAAIPAMANAADTPAPGASPVLIELFTSEGCSSCPPADAFLLQLDATQPIAGAQLIVLSEHMDYWNNGGWTDPYSSKELTARQSSYERALRIREPFTPQIIVDGLTDMRLQDRKTIAQILQNAAAAPKIPVRISALKVESGKSAALSGRIEVDGASEQHKADIFLGIAFDRIESKVLRGENRGQSLTHVAVVEDLTKVAALVPGQQFSQDFRTPLLAKMDPKNIRVVVFVQEAGLGKVVGSALQRTAGG